MLAISAIALPTIADAFNPLSQGGGQLVVILFAARIALQCAMAWYVFAAASRLVVRDAGPALFPPWMWGVMTLFGGWVSLVTVPVFFALLHYTTWSTPDVDVRWGGDGSRSPSGGLRGEQARRIQDAQAELRDAQEARRAAAPGEED